MFGQPCSRLLQSSFGQASQGRDLQAEAAVGGAGAHRVHEHQRVAMLDCIQMQIGNPAAGFGQCGEFEIMRGKQGVAAVG